jgi:metal-responsive CopG/Arc/MetJ family transcriptional regulator
MRVRTSLILDDALMAEIDEIAGEKQRRSIVVETALKEYVAREKRKQKAKPEAAAVKEKATAGRR